MDLIPILVKRIMISGQDIDVQNCRRVIFTMKIFAGKHCVI